MNEFNRIYLSGMVNIYPNTYVILYNYKNNNYHIAYRATKNEAVTWSKILEKAGFTITRITTNGQLESEASQKLREEFISYRR